MIGPYGATDGTKEAMKNAEIPPWRKRIAAIKGDSLLTSCHLSRKPMRMNPHDEYTPRAINMSKVMLGMNQKFDGMRANPGGSLASQTKKPTIIGQLSRKGTRNLAVLYPYVAPRVRPRMSRMMPKSMLRAPITSNRLNFSLLVLTSFARAPDV